MTIIFNLVLLIVGFVLLIKGADVFVDGASSTALNFKVSKMLIGLTIVAFGTSAPEFAVSVQAFLNHSTDIVLGNVVGSNITNILLILGVGALIRPFAVKDNTVKAELPITLLISGVFAALILDKFLGNANINMISRADAIVIILVFLVFINYLVRSAISQKKKGLIEQHEKAPFGLFKSLLMVVIGLICIVIGSDLVVDSATKIAQIIGVSQRVIALTIVAFGTSLPELVTTITSSKKGETDLLLGNIIGSNIFNICVVLGLPTLMFGNLVPSVVSLLDIVVLLLSAGLLYIFSLNGRTLTRGNGIAFLLIYIIYYVLIMFI